MTSEEASAEEGGGTAALNFSSVCSAENVDSVRFRVSGWDAVPSYCTAVQSRQLVTRDEGLLDKHLFIVGDIVVVCRLSRCCSSGG